MNLVAYSMIVSLLWGLQPILFKDIMDKIDVKLFFIVTNISILVGVLIYSIYFYDDIQNSLAIIGFDQIIKIILVAIISAFIPNLIYYNLLDKYESHNVSALTSCGPIFTVLLSFFIFKDDITSSDIFAVLLIVIGVILLSYKS